VRSVHVADAFNVNDHDAVHDYDYVDAN